VSQAEKSHLYQALKRAGVQFDDHFRKYSTEQLQQVAARLCEENPEAAVAVGLMPPPPDAEPRLPDFPDLPPVAGDFPAPAPVVSEQPRHSFPQQQMAGRIADELPGQRLNQVGEDEPLFTDELGRTWYQVEVLKPAMPKPRGRRVLTYIDTGVEQQSTKAGEYVETFEVAGSGPGRTAEIKITLPSYQVGIYKDPRFPFKIHTYNGNQGFDLYEVQNFYGGAELVPAECKRIYVENDLCYDIRTVVRAIETEYRQQQLAGRI